jgi:PAS domain S-box-containing protein
LLRVLVASRDVTVRRQSEEAQARFIRILEATPDYVGMATADGYPFYINAAGRRLIGVGQDDPLDFHFSATHPDWANAIVLEEGFPTAIRDGSWRGENALLHRDGHEIPVSQVLLAHRAPDGTVEYLSTIIRDLSDRKHAEIERIEWANRYDAAIRASGQVLFDWNSYTNEMNYAGDTEHILGYTIAELSGGLDRFRQLIHPADLPLFDQRIQQVVITRDPFHLEFRVQHKNCDVLSIETKGYFFLDRRGQIGRMVGFLADVTAQRRAQAVLAQAHDSLEIRVTERTAELARASALLEDRARRQEAVAHLGQRALASLNLKSLMEEAMQTIKNTLRVDCCSLLAMTRDGRDLLVRAQTGWPDPDFNGGRVPVGSRSQSGYTLMTGEAVISKDFTTEKRFTPSAAVLAADVKSGLSVMIKGDEGPLGVLAAFTFEQRNFIQDDIHFLQSVGTVLTAAIQRERAELSIRQAREEAEMASRAKSEFLSRMSHELRTPLNAILGFTQLLEIDAPSPSQAESVQHISRAGKHLLSLINEVLDVSRLEAGRLELITSPIEVHSFLVEAIELLRPLAQRHDVHLVLDAAVPPPVYLVLGDRHRLQQVMYNLLSNAVKYNHAGGRVAVSYRADGPRIRITVADTGRGIEADKLARLFLPFERLGAESTEVEGAGIGLALSRGIVTALHGELGVESRVGEGSTFWLALPRADETAGIEEAPSTPTSAPSPAERGKPHTILYIEDQDLNLRLVERILGPRPQYHLITAMLGAEGIALAWEERPDLILLDLNLPDMTGDAVLHRLKSDPTTRQIPVIMVSADAMGERNDTLLRLGASGYLTKPYKLDEFMRVIESALSKRKT